MHAGMQLTGNIHPGVLGDTRTVFSTHDSDRQFQTYTFSGEVRLLSLQFREDLQELLQEPNKFRSQIILVVDVRCSLGIPSSDRLFDIQYAGQVGPTVFVHRGLVLTPRPGERLPKNTKIVIIRYRRSIGTENEISVPHSPEVIPQERNIRDLRWSKSSTSRLSQSAQAGRTRRTATRMHQHPYTEHHQDETYKACLPFESRSCPH